MTSADRPRLEVRGLTAGYGNNTVVRDVSFSVPPRQVLTLLGHNGCGKTTTLNCVVGLNRIEKGEIWLDGERVDGLTVSARVNKGLRMLPGLRGVFSNLLVGDNLSVVADRNCRPDSRIDVKHVLELFPVLKTSMNKTAGSLSGGQQKILAMALAILGSPRCLLLDEPSIGLAPNLVERLFVQIREICQAIGVATVLVEQNVTAAMNIADHVSILNNGVMVFDGTPEEARQANFWHFF